MRKNDILLTSNLIEKLNQQTNNKLISQPYFKSNNNSNRYLKNIKISLIKLI